ncbi:xanthine dehydrogenase family protein molybdopterin-binding subunit [Ilumatobacter sp.]|uniref:xanthine dehydrogenase family protein molybdopterin-binding subunit n=1 Tax=Ilumatobacter sp. TaxID=1967498 RepID=UPI003C55D030
MTVTEPAADTPSNSSGLVGQSVTRVEDDRLLRGHGRYVADVSPDGVLQAVFLRSPMAHARITSIDVTAARRAPGVVAVFTGADIEAITHPFPPVGMLPDLYTPLFYALSSDTVRMVGDPVALVIAESRYLAEDAIELIDVDYEPLESVASIADGLSSNKPALWEKAGGNVLYDHTDTFTTAAGPDAASSDVDAVFASADRVITERLSCPRQSNQPMETRGSLVEVDPDTGHMTIRNATQSSHMLRWMGAALTGKQKVRSSLKEIVTNKQRRSGFMAGAKGFLGANADGLKAQDNNGMKSQLKADKSLLKHANAIGLGLLGKDDYPTVVADDIGGGFGSKGAIAREDIALIAAAGELGRSVRWIEDRVENLMDGGQAREEDLTLSIAVDNDGTLRGLKVDLLVDQGAYPGFPVGAPMATRIMKVMFPGSYAWDAFEMRSRIVATNKGKYVAYRGPWANETWARERMLDIVARALGMTPAEIRLKNLIGEDRMPTAMITGPAIDETMSTKKTLERALELLDMDAFSRDRAAAYRRNHRLGLGIACYHEAAPGPPGYWDCISPGTDVMMNEEAQATVEADGSVVVYTAQMPHGQSHETTYGQIVADELGVSIDDVTLIFGDTRRTPFSILGTGGSRGGPIGGGALKYAAREVREQVVDAAAKMLEADSADIEIVDGNIHVAGVPARGITYAELAADVTGSAGGSTNAFEATRGYKGKGDGGWSVATHACIVDVDLDTGKVTFPRYLVVEDCGPIINPAIVDGQVRGGVAQGIGAVLYEKATYDEDANLQSATYMDYLIPTAMEIPEIEVHHMETLSPGGENDFRGVGEGGMIGAPAAITNAIENALGPTARITSQYLPPSTILELAGVIPRE